MFKSNKKSWFDRFKKKPQPERNIVLDEALEGVAERLKRVASAPLEPHRPAFQADLLAKIREARGTQHSSMLENIKLGLARMFATARMKAIVAFVVLVAVVVTTAQLWPNGGRGLLISPAYAHDNFEVAPTKTDSLGLAPDSAFVIKSKMALSVSDLTKNISVIPHVQYKIDKVSDHEFTLTPTEPLKEKTIYKIYINSAYTGQNGVTVDRDYSWAFQVKNNFKIIGSLPRDKATGVPVNGGIEVTFNSDKVYDFEKYFSITPHVDGKFEYHGRTVSFVPKKLDYATLYTVTVDKTVPVKDSEERLSQNFVFQFETQQNAAINNSSQNAFYFNGSTSEFPTDQSPFLQMYYYGNGLASDLSIDVSVYAYTSANDYIAHLKEQDAAPEWTSYGREKHPLSEQGLSRITQFTASPTTFGYNNYLAFPNKLSAGYYLVVAKSGDTVQRVLLQITNVTTFLSVSQNKAVVWLNNMVTGKPVANAQVQLVGSATTAVSGQDGIASFDSRALAVNPEQSRDYVNYKKYLLIQVDNLSSIVPLYGYDASSWSTFDPQSYWSYLYTDRPLYKGNDSINLWGFVQAKNGEKTPSVTIQLLSSSYDYFGDSIVVDSKTVPVNNGSFTDSFKLKQAQPGIYSLVVKVGDNILSTRDITVDKYIKPSYQLEIQQAQTAVKAGESITYDVKASFFDGTPVPNLNLQYQVDGADAKNITTNGLGMVHVIIPTTYQPCDTSAEYCYNNVGRYFRVFPANGEEGEISAQAQTMVYSTLITPTVTFAQDDSRSARIAIHTDKTDLDVLNQFSDYEKANTPVSGVQFSARVVEITYTQRETGEYYDFISKKTYKTYDYDRNENQIDQFSGTTGDKGNYERQLQVDPEKSYKVIVVTTDDNGHQNITSNYLYTARNYEAPSIAANNFYSLQIRKSNNVQEPNAFSVGEKVVVDFKKNDKLFDEQKGTFLFYRLKQGLIDYTVRTNPSYEFNFEEKLIPNIQVMGVWFDGRSYHRTDSSYGNMVLFDKSDRELSITLTADKAKYEPGEDVVLKAVVTDKAGHPVQASLNLNLIDEAYYKIAGDYADPLSGLYSSVSTYEWYSYVSHRMLVPSAGGAEGGGCFLAGTKVLMANGTEKNIEDVTAGDTVLTYARELNHVLVPATVKDTIQHVVRDYLVINGVLKVTAEHRIFVNNGWMQIGEAKVGDTLLTQDGSYIKITSIEKETGLVPVYNLHIADKHTYIANGFYVHNDKGGDRSNFSDVAGFVSVQTDRNGQATAKLTLPDNITSWRVTAQGITSNLYAGVQTIDVPVSKPVFVESTFAPEYVATDKPIIKARAYGDALQNGNTVDLSLVSQSLGVTTNTIQGKAFEASYFDLPALTVGTYSVRVAVAHGNNTDAVIKPITVIPSRSVERVSRFYTLKNGTTIQANDAQGAVTVTLADEGRSQLQNSLYELSWSYGDRVDQRLGRVVSQDMLRTAFNANDWYLGNEQFDGSGYQMADGGIALLPYGSSDLELSVQTAPFTDGYFDATSLKSYFYSYLSNNKTTREELVLALTGLAELDEPVLTQLQSVVSIADLTPRERLYVALGLAHLGDTERARSIYTALLTQYGEYLTPVYRLKLGKDDDAHTQATALAAVVGVMLQDEHAKGLWQYVQDRPTTDLLIILPELAYVKEALPRLNAVPASATFVINGVKKDITTLNGYAPSFTLTKDELAAMKVQNVKGSVGLTTRYYTSTKTPASNASKALSIDRDYQVNNRSTRTFREGDTVEVTLTAHINRKDALQGNYEIIDYAPSGLTPVIDQYMIGKPDTCYPFAVDGQAVKFNTDYCNGTMRYYARVINPGSYVAEAPLIQSFKSDMVKNYGHEERITITQK